MRNRILSHEFKELADLLERPFQEFTPYYFSLPMDLRLNSAFPSDGPLILFPTKPES
jgi:hypothetical protein